MRSKTIHTLLLVLVLGAVAYVGARIMFATDGPCTPREPSPPTGAG